MSDLGSAGWEETQTWPVSQSQLNKAGRTIRRWMRGEQLPEGAWSQAIAIIQMYRAGHQYPLAKATMGLRSVVKTEGCRVEVSQRLKRMATIIDKLGREPTMALAKMQDIGGCRAVLESIEELRRVERRLRKNRPALAYYDYVAAPRPSGYRGVHLIVAYEGRQTGGVWTLEVQLRTRVMHEWAIAVERMGGRLQDDLKSGYGPPELLELLGAISEAMALEERGQPVPEELQARMVRLRAAAVRYLPGPQA